MSVRLFFPTGSSFSHNSIRNRACFLFFHIQAGMVLMYGQPGLATGESRISLVVPLHGRSAVITTDPCMRTQKKIRHPLLFVLTDDSSWWYTSWYDSMLVWFVFTMPISSPLYIWRSPDTQQEGMKHCGRQFAVCFAVVSKLGSSCGFVSWLPKR